MRKRGVALFVAALMIAALAFPAGANVNPFSDLRSDHWAYEAIVKLAAAGLVEGIPRRDLRWRPHVYTVRNGHGVCADPRAL